MCSRQSFIFGSQSYSSISANTCGLCQYFEQGDTVTYDGTDFLVLNSCTGLIDEVHSAQDLVTFFHNLGLTGITV